MGKARQVGHLPHSVQCKASNSELYNILRSLSGRKIKDNADFKTFQRAEKYTDFLIAVTPRKGHSLKKY